MRCILFLILSCFLYAADPPLPAEAAKIVAEHDKAVAAAKAAYDAAVAKADAEAAKKLDPVLVKVTKAGDLAGANAVKAVVDGYKASQGDLLGEVKVDSKKGMIAALDGKKWNWNGSGIVQFNTNGTISPNGTWEFLKNGKLFVTMGNKHTLTPVLEDGKLTSFDGVYGDGTVDQRTFKVILVPAKP